MAIEISVVIVSIVFLIIAAFAIPFLLQIWRTTKRISETFQMINERLPGILRNLEEVTTNINKVTSAVNEQIDGLSIVAKRIQGVAGAVTDVENLLRTGIGLPVFKTLRNTVAVVTGVKVFLKALLSSRKSP
jgi:uncharacterized protein YoxC